MSGGVEGEDRLKPSSRSCQSRKGGMEGKQREQDGSQLALGQRKSSRMRNKRRRRRRRRRKISWPVGRESRSDKGDGHLGGKTTQYVCLCACVPVGVWASVSQGRARLAERGILYHGIMIAFHAGRRDLDSGAHCLRPTNVAAVAGRPAESLVEQQRAGLLARSSRR